LGKSKDDLSDSRNASNEIAKNKIKCKCKNIDYLKIADEIK
jgi:hypothetical protein